MVEEVHAVAVGQFDIQQHDLWREGVEGRVSAPEGLDADQIVGFFIEVGAVDGGQG